MPHVVTPQNEAEPPLECSGRSTTTPPCQGFRAAWILHLLWLVFLARHSAESEEEKTVCDSWRQLRLVVAASGVVGAIINPQIPEDVLSLFIMVTFPLATSTGFLPGQPLHQMSPFFIVRNPVSTPPAVWPLLKNNYQLYCIFQESGFQTFWPRALHKKCILHCYQYLCTSTCKTEKNVVYNTYPCYRWGALVSIVYHCIIFIMSCFYF